MRCSGVSAATSEFSFSAPLAQSSVVVSPPLARNVTEGAADNSLRQHSQLAVSTETALYLYAVDIATHALVQFASMPVFTRVRGLARVSRMHGASQMLAVLSEHSKVSFVQYDTSSDSLVCTGSVFVSGPPVQLGDLSELRYAHLIAAHPKRPIIAVATYESSISVFAVQENSSKVSAGKILCESIDGIVLSLDFIEDDGRDGRLSVLIALVQKGARQYISVLAVGLESDAADEGISLATLASVGTCASRQDDAAVARAQFKLTGEPIRPPRTATAVSRMTGCPYVFVVFLEGRVVAADVLALVEGSDIARFRRRPGAMTDRFGRSVISELNLLNETKPRFIHGELRPGDDISWEGRDNLIADPSVSFVMDRADRNLERGLGARSGPSVSAVLGPADTRNVEHGGLSVTRGEPSGSTAIVDAASREWSGELSVELTKTLTSGSPEWELLTWKGALGRMQESLWIVNGAISAAAIFRGCMALTLL
jgi:hypothetical protein